MLVKGEVPSVQLINFIILFVRAYVRVQLANMPRVSISTSGPNYYYSSILQQSEVHENSSRRLYYYYRVWILSFYYYLCLLYRSFIGLLKSEHVCFGWPINPGPGEQKIIQYARDESRATRRGGAARECGWTDGRCYMMNTRVHVWFSALLCINVLLAISQSTIVCTISQNIVHGYKR